jgi:hypothetical protein
MKGKTTLTATVDSYRENGIPAGSPLGGMKGKTTLTARQVYCRKLPEGCMAKPTGSYKRIDS